MSGRQRMTKSLDDLENPKHVKIKTYNQQKDGSVRAITESYYETLTSRKVEVIKRFPTSKDTYYTDIISASDVVASQQTNELDFKIIFDDTRKPKWIVRTHSLYREDFGRNR